MWRNKGPALCVLELSQGVGFTLIARGARGIRDEALNDLVERMRPRVIQIMVTETLHTSCTTLHR